MTGFAILVVLLGLLVPLALYLLIAAETSDPRVVDRETAIREAKATGGRGPTPSTPADDERATNDERESDDVEFGWIDGRPDESDERNESVERGRR